MAESDECLGIKQFGKALSIGTHALRVLLRNEAQLRICVNNRPDMPCFCEVGDDLTNDCELIRIRENGLDSGRYLQRIGGVGHDDPVAVSILGKFFGQLGLPGLAVRCSGAQSRNDQNQNRPSSHHSYTLPGPTTTVNFLSCSEFQRVSQRDLDPLTIPR